MKSVTFLVSVLLATALASQANAHGGKRDPLAREAAMATIIQSVDAGTAASIEQRAKQIKRQHAELRALREAATADSTAIAAARQALRSSRAEMGDEIQRVLSEQPELRAQLKAQRRSVKQQRLLTRFTVANDDAFALLLETAPQDVQQQLSTNRQLLADARANIRAVKHSGASKTQLKSLRRNTRELFHAQRAIVADILADNSEVQSQLVSMADNTDFRHRRHKH